MFTASRALSRIIIMIPLIGVIILVCFDGLQCSNIVIQGKTNVQAGDTLSLSCNGTNLHSPPANVDWFRNDDKLIANERISISVYTKVVDQSKRTVSTALTINNMAKQDEGQYKCWISNNLNDHVTVHVSGGVNSGAETKYLMTSSTSALILTAIAFYTNHR